MGGHVEGNDVMPIGPQDEEAEQDGERDPVDGEEVEGGDRGGGVPEERPPHPRPPRPARVVGGGVASIVAMVKAAGAQ
jgi:hypothetical protein